MIAIKTMEEMPESCNECRMKRKCEQGFAGGWREDKRAYDCPLIDIVTCKDCNHHEAILAAKNTDGSKKVLHICQRHGNIVSEDYYCADGAREEEPSNFDDTFVNGLPRSEEYFEERITGNPDFCNG